MELKIKRLMTGLAGFAAALFLVAAGAFGTESIYGAEADGQGRTQDIIILHTNDVHCGVDDNIGYAGLALYKKEMLLERISPKDVILLDTAGISSMYAADGGIIVVV